MKSVKRINNSGYSEYIKTLEISSGVFYYYTAILLQYHEKLKKMVTQFNKKDMMSFAKSISPDKEIGEKDFQNWLSIKDEDSVLIRKPRVGDIVIFIASPEGEYDKHARNNFHWDEPLEVPALITRVWSDDCVNLTVFPDAADYPNNPDEHCPQSFSITSCCKLPAGTRNPQTAMWKFK